MAPCVYGRATGLATERRYLGGDMSAVLRVTMTTDEVTASWGSSLTGWLISIVVPRIQTTQ